MECCSCLTPPEGSPEQYTTKIVLFVIFLFPCTTLFVPAHSFDLLVGIPGLHGLLSEISEWPRLVAAWDVTRPSFFRFRQDRCVIGKTVSRYRITDSWAQVAWERFIVQRIPSSAVRLHSRCCRRNCPRHRFITCDSPLVVFTPFPDGQASFGGGLGLVTTEIHFPIRPTRCFFMKRQNSPIYDLLGPNPIAELYRRTAFMAERFVMSSQNTRTIRELVSEASCTRGLPKLEPGFAEAIPKEGKGSDSNDDTGESADPSDTEPGDSIG